MIGAPERRLEGRGLHGGRPCAVRFSRARGWTTLGGGGRSALLGALAVTAADRATSVRIDESRLVAGVEHLLAAVQGLDAFAGLSIEVEGGEVPLIDGCASAFAQAIEATRDASERRAPVRVVGVGVVRVEQASYEFAPSAAPDVEVEVDFPLARFGVALAGKAAWSGGRAEFLRDVAPSRTFGARRELEALRARGLAAHLPAGCVVALDVDEPAWSPRDAGEPVRHKLLDLLGDLALLGGRFVGRLRASRPSHAATATAIGEARRRGWLAVP